MHRQHTTALRAAIYVRVSDPSQIEGHSLDAQARLCREYAGSKGFDVAHEYRDEGKSAASDSLKRRLQFRRILEDAEGERFDALIVEVQDRFARNQLVLYTCLHRLEAARVRFYTGREDLDYTSATGRLTLGVKGCVAEWFSLNLSDEVKKGKRERARKGYHCTRLPFGATLNDEGLGVPDTEGLYSVLLQIMEMGASGMSLTGIARDLNPRAISSPVSKVWTQSSVGVVLSNRYYLGEIRDGGA